MALKSEKRTRRVREPNNGPSLSVDASLDGVSFVVEDEEDRLQAKLNHRGYLLRRQLTKVIKLALFWTATASMIQLTHCRLQ